MDAALVPVAGAVLAATGLADSSGHLRVLSFEPVDRVWLWIVGAGLLVIGSATSGFNRLRSERLARENRDLRLRAGVASKALTDLRQHELKMLGDVLHHFSAERISLFVPCPEGFRLIARYSKGGLLNGPARLRYPLHEGSVGRAWANATDHATLPDPVVDEHAWLAAQQHVYDVPPETATKFRMKSRTYTSVRLESADGHFLGVLVLESQRDIQAMQAGGTVMDLAAVELCLQMEGKGARLREWLIAITPLLDSDT